MPAALRPSVDSVPLDTTVPQTSGIHIAGGENAEDGDHVAIHHCNICPRFRIYPISVSTKPLRGKISGSDCPSFARQGRKGGQG